jgi:hypothetical protein
MAVFRPDILIQSPQGRPIAVVEVKNRQNFSRDIAKEYRRNLLTHGMYPQGPFFLFTSQDVGFIWTESKENILDAEPSYEFPMDNVLIRYMRRKPEERLYGFQLKTLIHQWLDDLTQGQQKAIEEPEKTLALAGFNESIKGAIVIEEAEQ